MVGERGGQLSGGERQRIAIARAVLKDAPILVLDEATSALDVETEDRVKEAIDELRRDRTTFIIAHRLTTVRDADLVVFMDKGRVVEMGGFAELSLRNGRFASLLRAGGLLNDEEVRRLSRIAVAGRGRLSELLRASPSREKAAPATLRSIAPIAPAVYVEPHERHDFTPDRLDGSCQPDALRRAGRHGSCRGWRRSPRSSSPSASI